MDVSVNNLMCKKEGKEENCSNVYFLKEFVIDLLLEHVQSI